MKMLRSWSQKGKAKLSNAFSFLGNKIFPWRSSMAAPETELTTAPGADPANMTLSISESERAAVSISGTASSSGQHLLSGEVRIDMEDDGDTQSSAGIEEDGEESVQGIEARFSSNENSGAPVSGSRAYLSLSAPLQVAYILFGIRTNIALSIFNIKSILDMELPGSTPALSEGVLAAAAGIGLLASSSAICLQVKRPRSGLAKVLSQISVVFLGSSLLFKLSTRFVFEQYMPVNVVTTAVLFLFMVGVVIWAGISTAVN